MLNIFKKLKSLIKEFRKYEQQQIEQLSELEWAHIYNDTIRGKKWLEELGISPGRWAGNYSFFYVLARILLDFNPKKIIEFGLGESSKMISSYVVNESTNTTHLILEQSEDWIEKFDLRYSLSTNSKIIHLPMMDKRVNQFSTRGYEGIETKITESFDLYVIDGPYGSEHFSRYDICLLAEKFHPDDEFIIILDDFNRQGEKDTVGDLLMKLNKKGIKTYTGIYSGRRTQIVIVTEKYKHLISL